MRITVTNFRYWPAMVAIAVLLAAIVVAYLPGVNGPFLFDDNTSITDNPALHLAGFAIHDLMHAAFSSHAGLLYRPISMLTFAFNYTFFGNGVFSFKLTNVIIHLINALLFLWLTLRLLQACRRRYQFKWSDTQLSWLAIIVATAWALHPLNLTAVLYVVQRMTSLAALFTLCGTLAYIHGRERSLTGKTGWPLVWILTPAFGVLGVLSKEDAALLPLFLLIIEWLLFGFRDPVKTLDGPIISASAPSIQESGPLSTEAGLTPVQSSYKRFTDQRKAKNIIIFYLVGLVLPGLLGVGYLVLHHFWAGYASRPFTLTERLLTECRVVFLYIKWTFVPDIRELALYHDDIAISTSLLHPITTLLSLLALLAMLALAVWQRHKRPLLCLGILWFFAGQMMESTVIPLLLVFEHRNYLADYGLLFAFFSLLLLPGETGKHLLRPSLRWTVAALTLPVLFSATFVRAGEWGNFLSFAYYESRHHPHSEEALYALGQAYSDLALASQLKNPQVALEALSRAAKQGDSIMPDVAMMIVAAKLKMPVQSEWSEHARSLLLAHPIDVQVTQSLNALVNCLPTACDTLGIQTGQLLQTAFQSAQRHGQNADLWVIYGNYLTFTGHPLNEITTAMLQAAKLRPKVPQYQVNVAEGYIALGDFTAAEGRIAALARLNKFGSQDQNIAMLKQRLAAARTEAVKSSQGPTKDPSPP